MTTNVHAQLKHDVDLARGFRFKNFGILPSSWLPHKLTTEPSEAKCWQPKMRVNSGRSAFELRSS